MRYKLKYSIKIIITFKTWLLHYLVRITLYYFRYDKLYIHDGKNESGQTIGAAFYTGSGPTENITSSGQDIFLRFTSDYTGQQTGFLIQYDQGKIFDFPKSGNNFNFI